jgi:hypothetical protein
MQAGGDVVRAKVSQVSDEAGTEMKEGRMERVEQATQEASSQVPFEQPNGPLYLHPIGTRAILPLHFTIDVDWVHGSESGLRGLLDFCDRWKLKATIFVAGRFAEAHAELIGECRWRGHELGTHGRISDPPAMTSSENGSGWLQTLWRKPQGFAPWFSAHQTCG